MRSLRTCWHLFFACSWSPDWSDVFWFLPRSWQSLIILMKVDFMFLFGLNGLLLHLPLIDPKTAGHRCLLPSLICLPFHVPCGLESGAHSADNGLMKASDSCRLRYSEFTLEHIGNPLPRGFHFNQKLSGSKSYLVLFRKYSKLCCASLLGLAYNCKKKSKLSKCHFNFAAYRVYTSYRQRFGNRQSFDNTNKLRVCVSIIIKYYLIFCS